MQTPVWHAISSTPADQNDSLQGFCVSEQGVLDNDAWHEIRLTCPSCRERPDGRANTSDLGCSVRIM